MRFLRLQTILKHLKKCLFLIHQLLDWFPSFNNKIMSLNFCENQTETWLQQLNFFNPSDVFLSPCEFEDTQTFDYQLLIFENCYLNIWMTQKFRQLSNVRFQRGLWKHLLTHCDLKLNWQKNENITSGVLNVCEVSLVAVQWKPHLLKSYILYIYIILLYIL